MLILPAIDLIKGQCVRLFQGDFSRIKKYANDPLEVAKKFVSEGARFIHIVDLEGAKEGKIKNQKIAIEIARIFRNKLSVEFGGGIRTYNDAEYLLKNSIERIILGTALFSDIDLIRRLIKNFGQERIIISVDMKDSFPAICGWRKTTKESLKTIFRKIKKLGLTQIIFTDIKSDGTMTGPNYENIKQILKSGLAITVAGGISRLEDIIKLRDLGVTGAIIGKALYENKIDLKEALRNSERSFLAKRIIPCMDMKNGRVVKCVNYLNPKDAGDPVKWGKIYSDMGADEIVFLDITATIEKRPALYKLVSKIAKKINIPFTVGGGVKNIEDIQNLLNAGADKVAIGSEAVKNPELIKKAARKFGSQCLVVSIDAKKKDNSWKCTINGGRILTDVDAVKFAKQMSANGAGELLVNSLDRDGMKNGYDLELLKKISNAVNISVIASSGAGSKEDFLEVFKKTNVDAALAASLFHYGEIKIPELKQYLFKNNVTIRI